MKISNIISSIIKSSLIKVLILLVLISIAGWAVSVTGVMENKPPVTSDFVLNIQVLDVNGTPIPDQKVYLLSCLQKPAGWTTPTSFIDNDSEYGFTDKGGFVVLESVNYTLTKNDIVWLGASTNISLLESDHNKKTFKPGIVGEWTHYEYNNISRYGPIVTEWASIIIVRNSDGKMIDIDQYTSEHGLNYLGIHSQPPSYPDDYLKYIDNQYLLRFT